MECRPWGVLAGPGLELEGGGRRAVRAAGCMQGPPAPPPREDVRVAGGRDEVQAAVDACVGDALLPVDVDLLLQVLLILVVDELHDGLPAVLVVDVVPEAGGVDDGQLHPDALLLDVCTDHSTRRARGGPGPRHPECTGPRRVPGVLMLPGQPCPSGAPGGSAG